MARGSSEIAKTFEIEAMLVGRGFRTSDPATGTSSNEDAGTGTPKEPLHVRDRNDLEAELRCLFLQSKFSSFLSLFLESHEHALIVRLLCGQQMKHDPRQFVGCRGDRGGFT